MKKPRTRKNIFFHKESVVQTGNNSQQITILDIKNNVGTKVVKTVVNGKTTSSKKTKLSHAAVMKESKQLDTFHFMPSSIMSASPILRIEFAPKRKTKKNILFL
jgi:hypothetical protein